MINSAVRAYYRSQIVIKVFLFGLLVILASTFFTWIKLEGLFAIFAGNEMKKFIAGIKSITVVACVLSLLWLVAGLFLNEKKIQWFSISSLPLVILFFYMAYNSFVDKESTAKDKIYTIIFFISCGLLYVIPMILAIRNNFKSVFLNINFTLFILLLILLYVIDKFGASAMKTLGILLQFAFNVAIIGVLISLITSIILTVKVKKNLHFVSTECSSNTDDQAHEVLP